MSRCLAVAIATAPSSTAMNCMWQTRLTTALCEQLEHRARCLFTSAHLTHNASSTANNDAPKTRIHEAPSPPASEKVDFGFKEVPKNEKVNLVAQVFSSVASSYDVMNDLMSAGLHRLWKDRLVADLCPFPGQVHLDVAGGTGDVAFRVLRALRKSEAEEQHRLGHQVRFPATPPSPSPTTHTPSPTASPSSPPSSSSTTTPPFTSPSSPSPLDSSSDSATRLVRGSVVVLDINPEMLQVGREKAAAARDLSSDEGLVFVEGNAERLPFPDNSFDSYTIAFGIRNVTDRSAALREARRVLRRGGRFMCLEFSQVKTSVLRELYDQYSFHVIPRIGGLVANDESAYTYLVESIRKFPNQDTFAAMMEDAGLRAVRYENLMDGLVAIHSGFKLTPASS